MSTVLARPAIKIAATIVVALSVALSFLLASVGAAPSAQAAPRNTNYTWIKDTNWESFKQGKGSYFSISVKAASSPGGKGIAGKAQVKVDGRILRTRVLDKGSFTFHVSRKSLPNNRWAEVAVRTWPKNSDSVDRPSKVVKFNVKDVVKSTSSGSKAAKVAKAQVGDRYVYGAAGPSKFDCSGLVVYSYKKATGKNLPHSSASLRNVGTKISKASTRPGDLAVSKGHVSIVIEPGAKKVVEAASPATGVRTSPLWQKGVTYVRP